MGLAVATCGSPMGSSPWCPHHDEKLGGAGTYLIFCLFNVMSLIFYMKFVPETKYHSLEELEARFEKEYS